MSCATTGTPAPPAGPWHDGDLAVRAEQLAERHVHIVAGNTWSVEELDAIARVLDVTPDFLLPDARDPLRIARIDRPCLFGIGRYGGKCPTFADDGTLLLYDVTVAHHPDSPTRRLEALNVDDRHRLLRMRAVVHALVVRADEDFRWSRSLRWRRINGWNPAGTRPMNRHVGGYLRPLGARSAHLDLVTSMEAFFVREEDLALRSEQGPSKLDPDMTFTCQEFTRDRVLSELLDEADPNWRGQSWRSDDTELPKCRAFEAWADLENIDGIDILFASEQTSRPESLFGHLLIHVRHGSERKVRSEGFEYVYQFGAVTDPEVDPLSYLVYGMTGNFVAIFDLSTFRGIDYAYLQLEQRTLRRHALRLSDDEIEHLMERIWESERRVAYPYYFSTHNCASMLIDLLAPVVGGDEAISRRPIAMPTEILDDLARIDAADGGPLLEKRADDVLSAADRALAARQIRRQIAAELDDSASELARLIEEIPGLPPEIRIETYAELADRLLASQEAARGLSNSEIVALIESFVAMERVRLERANTRLLDYHDRALKEDLSLGVDEVFELRRHLYRDEDLARRARERNELSRQRFLRFRDAHRRRPSSRELELRKKRTRLDGAYDAAAEAQARIVEEMRAKNGHFDPVEHHRWQRQVRQSAQLELDDRSLVPSNGSRLRLGLQLPVEIAGVTTDEAIVAPSVDLGFAVLDDLLGQRRLHGHRPRIEAVGLAGRLRAPLIRRPQDGLDFEFTALRYITLANRPGGVNWRLFDSLGWGVEAEARAQRRTLPVSMHAFFGIFYPLAISRSGVDHLALGAGPVLAADADSRSLSPSPGAQGYLLARKHLAGSFANSATLRLRHQESLRVPQWASRRRTDLRAGLDVYVPLGRRGVLVSPHLEAELHQHRGHPAVDDRRLSLGILIEPLRRAHH